jgi:hypothetical protein
MVVAGDCPIMVPTTMRVRVLHYKGQHEAHRLEIMYVHVYRCRFDDDVKNG